MTAVRSAHHICAITCIAAACGHPFAVAQTVPSVSAAAAGTPEVVTVTGRSSAKSASLGLLGKQDTMDAPFSLSTYTARDIQDQMARTVIDLMANDPSIQIPSAADGVYDNFTIRGFTGTTATHSLNGLYGVLPVQNMALQGFERVEIIKGPTALLTGSGPFGYAGGAANFVPKRAPDAPLNNVALEVSGHGQAGLHVDMARRYGDGGALGVRVNAYGRDGDAAVDDQQEWLTLGVIALDWRGPGLKLALDAGIQRYTIDHPTFGITITSGVPVPAPPPAGSNPFPDWTRAFSEDRYGMVSGEYALTPDVKAFAAIGARTGDSYIPNAYVNIEDAGGNTLVFPSFEPYYAHTHFSANAGLQARFDTGAVEHRVAAVASMLRYQTGYTFTLDDFSFASNLYRPVNGDVPASFFESSRSPPKAADYVDSGVSLADNIGFMDDALQVVLGMRYQRFQVDSFDVFSGAATSAYDRSETSPSFGVVGRVQPNVSVYANYMVGLSASPVAPPDAANKGEVFAPIKTEQIEAGAKLDLGGALASLAVYEIKQPSGYTDSSNTFRMAGRQRNRGLELALVGEVTKGLRTNIAASVIDAKLTRTADGAQDGNRAVGVPRSAFVVGGEWDVIGVPGFTLTGRATRTDEQYVDVDNTQQIPAWWRLDLGARYAFQPVGHPVTLRLNVLNVTDRSYWASAFGSRLTLGTPQTVSFSASTQF